MTRYLAAVLAVLLGGMAASASAGPWAITVDNVHYTPGDLRDAAGDAGGDCATLLRTLQQEPYRFRIASMRTSVSPIVILVYTLDGPGVEEEGGVVKSEAIVTCLLSSPA